MLRICLAVLAGTMLLAAGGTAVAVEAIVSSTLDRAGGVIRELKPGESFDIVGDCLALAQAARDVQVVLSLDEKPDGTKMGYSSVLATEQELRDQSLHVRVPEMPEMANHVFRVRVFALGGDVPAACDAGQIRIG